MPTNEPYRPIFPSEWQDPRLWRLFQENREAGHKNALIWLYLRTNPDTTPLGIYQMSEVRVHANRCGMGPEPFLEGIGRVCERFGWEFDHDENTDKCFILLYGWWKANPPSGENLCISLLKHLDTIPAHPFKCRFLHSLTWLPGEWRRVKTWIAERINTPSEPLLNPSATPTEPLERTDTGTVTDTSTDISTTTSTLVIDVQKPEQEQPPKDRPLDWMEVILSEWEAVTGVNPGGCDERATHQTGPAWHEFWEKRGEPALRQVVRFYLETTGPQYISFPSFIGKTGLSIAPRALEVQGWLNGTETSETEAEPEKTPPTPVSADMAAVWNDASEKIAAKIGDEDFNTWFDGVWLTKLSDGVAVIWAPSNHRAKCIKGDYNNLLVEILSRIASEPVEIKYEAKEGTR